MLYSTISMALSGALDIAELSTTINQIIFMDISTTIGYETHNKILELEMKILTAEQDDQRTAITNKKMLITKICNLKRLDSLRIEFEAVEKINFLFKMQKKLLNALQLYISS